MSSKDSDVTPPKPKRPSEVAKNDKVARIIVRRRRVNVSNNSASNAMLGLLKQSSESSKPTNETEWIPYIHPQLKFIQLE